jgi:hypothetical protein
MQELISVPEHGYSKYNAVVGGTAFNRSFASENFMTVYHVLLPSRNDMTLFIDQHDNSLFTDIELRDFFNSDFMSGRFYDPSLTNSPRVDKVIEDGKEHLFLSESEVIESWLRNPSAWTEANYSEITVPYSSTKGWTDSRITNDKAKKKTFGRWGAVNTVSGLVARGGAVAEPFTKSLFGVEGVITIAELSGLMDDGLIAEGVMPLFDMACVPFSAFQKAADLIYGGDTENLFVSITSNWDEQATPIARRLLNLDVRNGSPVNDDAVMWAFVGITKNTDGSLADECLKRGITAEKALPYINRHINTPNLADFIENDIDVHIVEHLFDEVDN